MKTNLKPQPLYGRTRLQHMTRLAVTALTIAMLSGLVSGCDATDPVVNPGPRISDQSVPSGPSGTSGTSGTSTPSGCQSSHPFLAATWDLIGYSKNGIEREATGTYFFRTEDGMLIIHATIGGLDVSGEFPYNQTGLSVRIAGTRYSLFFCGNEVTLSGGASTYTLKSRH